MRAVWLENRRVELRDVPAPAIPSGESLVRVRLAGICNTDLELTRGYYPFTGIPGHEFVGEVDGQRVVGEINAVCGNCETCRGNDRSHCPNRTVLGIANRHGAFAESLALPTENLHSVPPEVSDDEAVFVEPLAAALEIQEQVKITPQDRVVVVGDGKLGQLVAQTLALTGCKLLVIGHHAGKLALLSSRGIDVTMDDPQRSFDIAVDCTGNPEGFELARRALRPRGTLVMKSTYAGTLTVNASSLVVDEITVIGSRCGPFPRALDLLRARAIEVRFLIQSTYELNDALTAFDHAQRRGALKILIRPNQ